MDDMKRIELETSAASLYDGGWRAADKDELQKEYSLDDEELEIIVEKLTDYENR